MYMPNMFDPIAQKLTVVRFFFFNWLFSSPLENCASDVGT